MARSNRGMAQDGYKPLNEGYQPTKGQVLEKGYTPAHGGSSGQHPPKPPSGGSSASKPTSGGLPRK